MIMSFNFLLSSDFNGNRCLERWTWQQDPQVAPSCPIQVEEYEHAFITLQFDSTLPENINPHLHRGHNTQENYSFTVKQRALAEEAQTVSSLEELEHAVMSFQRFMLTILTLSYSWMKCLQKVIALMTHLCNWIQTYFQSGK